MANDLPTSILTESQRKWIRGEKEPAQERTMRTRTHERIRAAIAEDGPLLAKALEDGHIDAETIAREAEWGDWGVGIDKFVSVLYEIGSAVPALDIETAIDKGIARGRKGRIAVLREQFDEDPDKLGLSQLRDLYEAGAIDRVEYGDTIRENLPEGLSGGFMSEDELAKYIEEHTSEPDGDE